MSESIRLHLLRERARYMDISDIEYGTANSEIVVVPSSPFGIPLMLNREISSGYWDHPVRVAPKETIFIFVRFFDWDWLGIRDYRYVEVIVSRWPSNDDLVGKHVLVETRYVNFKSSVQQL